MLEFQTQNSCFARSQHASSWTPAQSAAEPNSNHFHAKSQRSVFKGGAARGAGALRGFARRGRRFPRRAAGRPRSRSPQRPAGSRGGAGGRAGPGRGGGGAGEGRGLAAARGHGAGERVEKPAAEVAHPPRPVRPRPPRSAASGRLRGRFSVRPTRLSPSPPALWAAEPGRAGRRRRRLPPEENGRGEVTRRPPAGPGPGGSERRADSRRVRASPRELPAGAGLRAAAARRCR